MKKITYIITLAFLFIGNQKAVAQENYLGEIQMFSGDYAPRGWAKCEGQLLPISQNQALFSLLGTMYGGNGQTTFALPDLRGRVPVYYNNTTIVQGQMAGTENNTLTVSQLPAHSHTVNAVASDSNQNNPAGNLPADTKQLDPEYSNVAANTLMKPSMLSNTGGSQPVNNVQPFRAVTFIIALTGIYPPRN